MREQATVANHIMERIERQPEVNNGGNARGAGVNLEYLKFVEFKKTNQPNFLGTFHLDKAEEWIKMIEKIFLCWPIPRIKR